MHLHILFHLSRMLVLFYVYLLYFAYYFILGYYLFFSVQISIRLLMMFLCPFAITLFYISVPNKSVCIESRFHLVGEQVLATFRFCFSDPARCMCPDEELQFHMLLIFYEPVSCLQRNHVMLHTVFI